MNINLQSISDGKATAASYSVPPVLRHGLPDGALTPQDRETIIKRFHVLGHSIARIARDYRRGHNTIEDVVRIRIARAA